MAELERAAAEIPPDHRGHAHVHFADGGDYLDDAYDYPIAPAPTPMPAYAHHPAPVYARHSISGPRYAHDAYYSHGARYPRPPPHSSRSYSMSYAHAPMPLHYAVPQPIGPALSSAHAHAHSHLGGGHHGLAHFSMAREHARMRRGPPFPGQRGHYRFPR